MPERITIVPSEIMLELAGRPINPFLSVLVIQDRLAFSDIGFVLSQWQEQPHPRALAALAYLRHLHGVAGETELPVARQDGRRDQNLIIFQAEDIAENFNSVSWQMRADWKNVRLVPDLYYFNARGYDDYAPALPAWRDRKPSLAWRGSTSGLIGMSFADLDRLPRYRLCQIAMSLGEQADVAFTDVVQAVSEGDAQSMRDRLLSEGMVKPFIPMEEIGLHQFVVDIDGNANSWNFMMKLRLGSCVLKVESDWRQWFSDRLIAWRHYVPIATDLSDLTEKFVWCAAHPMQSAYIAEEGARFAREMRFDQEMQSAAHTLFLSS